MSILREEMHKALKSGDKDRIREVFSLCRKSWKEGSNDEELEEIVLSFQKPTPVPVEHNIPANGKIDEPYINAAGEPLPF